MESTLHNMQDAGQLLATHLNEAAIIIQDFKRVSPLQAYETSERIHFKAHIYQIIDVLAHNPEIPTHSF